MTSPARDSASAGAERSILTSRWRVGALALALASTLLVVVSDRASPSAACDPLAARAVSELTAYTSWLDENHVAGVVGEVGWPTASTGDWGPVAEPWVSTALDRGVGVYVWGAAESWAPTYPLAVYRSSTTGELVAGTQSRLVERMSAERGPGVAALRGVALASPSFGASFEDSAHYSSTDPGVRGTDYAYPSQRFLAQLADRGIRSVRLAVMWERLQPRPFAPLDEGELTELRRVLRDAAGLGMTVVVDLHNYGRYAEGSATAGRRVLLVGSSALPASGLADLWRRVALALHESPALAAYGLMNEPHDLPGGAAGWEATTRTVVASVRDVDPGTLLLVPGYGWSAVADWRANHPVPWVHDPGVAYEAHQYFDGDRSGAYVLPIDEEQARAVAASLHVPSTACTDGWPPDRSPRATAERSG